MENAEIIKSQAFKVINKMIDGKVQKINGYIAMLKDITIYKTEYGYSVNVRTSLESGGKMGGESVMFPIQQDFIDRMKWLLAEIEKEKSMIHDLQAFKLNLLNDWDFTKGDDSLQKEIFGNDS